jgi:hypothetical protein
MTDFFDDFKIDCFDFEEPELALVKSNSVFASYLHSTMDDLIKVEQSVYDIASFMIPQANSSGFTDHYQLSLKRQPPSNKKLRASPTASTQTSRKSSAIIPRMSKVHMRRETQRQSV